MKDTFARFVTLKYLVTATMRSGTQHRHCAFSSAMENDICMSENMSTTVAESTIDMAWTEMLNVTFTVVLKHSSECIFLCFTSFLT